MSAAVMTAADPADLVEQWLPKLRKIAFRTNNDINDVKQEAWLLAASDVRNSDAADFVPRWLRAIENQARYQMPHAVFDAGTLPEAAHFDDPESIFDGVQRVIDRICKMHANQTPREALAAAIETPVTTKEIAAALGLSERQSRRVKKKLEDAAKVQGDLFSGDESKGGE